MESYIANLPQTIEKWTFKIMKNNISGSEMKKSKAEIIIYLFCNISQLLPKLSDKDRGQIEGVFSTKIYENLSGFVDKKTDINEFVRSRFQYYFNNWKADDNFNIYMNSLEIEKIFFEMQLMDIETISRSVSIENVDPRVMMKKKWPEKLLNYRLAWTQYNKKYF